MTHSPADIIRQVLLNTHIGVEDRQQDWAVFVGFLPNFPNSALCVYDTPGRLDGRLQSTGETIEHPGVQIYIRGTEYGATWAKMQEVSQGIDVLRRELVVLDTTRYRLHNVSKSGAPISLGVEAEGDRRRHQFTVNAVLTVTQEN